MDADSSRPVDLRTNAVETPHNVAERPRFDWHIEADRRQAAQSAYQLQLGTDPNDLAAGTGLMWDSGTVESDRAIGVPYEGQPLDPGSRYYWRVRVRNERDEWTPFSEPATFDTAPESFDGAWIGHQPDGGDVDGYRSEWRTPDEVEEWVQVDLGTERAIETVRLRAACPHRGVETPDGLTVSPMFSRGHEPGDTPVHHPPVIYGFGFPTGFRVEVATDPACEHVVATASYEDVENPGQEPVTVDIEATGRYVRVTATELYTVDPEHAQRKLAFDREEHRAWQVFALAELGVREGGEHLGRGRPTTASSTVETAGWGTAALTDGHGSRMASSAPLLREEFELTGPVDRAVLHVAGLGYSECYLNGARVGEDVLNPAWTQFDERVLYESYDVTDRLEPGENALGVWLGRGWFAKSFYDWTGFGSPRAKLSLAVTYADGTSRTVSTGGSWRASESPIVENDVYDGETYDARREEPGWAEPGFDDSEWSNAHEVDGPGGSLHPQRVEPMRVVEEVKPEAIQGHPDGPIVDFGQNLTGWVSLSIEDPATGDEITMRHAEALTDDGDLSTIDLRTADATDTYIARGEDREAYEPRFTYHGFRYAQIRGYPGTLTEEDAVAKVVHTAMPQTGSFACSNADLEAVQQAATWGLRGNSHAVPTDCPQRDERFGWTGDGRLTARAFQYNFDARRFHDKWMADHADAQSRHGYVPDTIPYGFGTIPADPSWSLTTVLLPWTLYRHYGDPSVLRRHFPTIRRYVEYWHSVAEDGIVPAEFGNYGDWLALEDPAGSESSAGGPLALFNTASHYEATTMAADIAEALEDDASAERYRGRANDIANAFNARFLDEEAGRYDPGTQAAQAVPLSLDIVPAAHRESVAASLAERVKSAGGKLQTGFLGTHALLDALVETGYAELAYRVVSQPDQPGWVYMIRNGATTLWERWDSDRQVGSGMNSLNHSPFTMVSEWFFEHLAGIRPRLDDGRVVVAPIVVDELDWVNASVGTPHGPVESAWERVGTAVTAAITIPWNTIGEIHPPAWCEGVAVNGTVIWPAGDGAAGDVKGVRTVDDDGTIEVAPGDYELRFDE